MTGRPTRVQHPPHGCDAARRGGFVLPVALVVLVLLAMIAATGLYAARADLRSAVSGRQAALALVAADAGSNRTIALWSDLVPSLPAPGDSVLLDWAPLPGGASYRSVVVRPPSDPDAPPSTTVILRTTGRVAPPGRARRTVERQLAATPGFGRICCDAGVRSTGRFRVDGSDRNDPLPEIDGLDRIPDGWPASSCTASGGNQAGLRVPTDRDAEIRGRGDVSGAPAVLVDATLDPATFTDLGGSTFGDLAASADHTFEGNTRIRDLAPVVSGGACDTSDPSNWGDPDDPTAACGGHFPLIYVAGDLRLERGARGQGILLVDGDFELRDDAAFYGLVIVLGRARIEDDSRLYGGLLVRGGPDGGDRSEIRDRAKVAYSSCAVSRAQALGVGSGGGATAESWTEVFR